MENIELYDILTLEDNEEYTVIKKLTENNKNYLLLAPIDKEENPDFDKIKIVEEIKEDGETLVEEIEDDELLKSLSTQFLSTIKNDLE